MNIKAAIFDLDGTLVKLPIDYLSLYEEFQQITGIENIEPITKTLTALNESLKQKVFEAWARAESAVLPRMSIVEEGVRLYNQHSKIPKALVTMQGTKTVKKTLSILKMSFMVVVTREDSLNRTEQIRLALEKLKLKPEDAIVIGDRETDKIAAKNVGCKFIMVTH